MRPTLTILGTGGTIASTTQASGAAPSKRSEELLDAVPHLAEYADVSAREVSQKGGFAMDVATVEKLRRVIQEEVESGVDGSS